MWKRRRRPRRTKSLHFLSLRMLTTFCTQLLQCWSLHQKSTYIQFKWTPWAEVLLFQKLPGGNLWVHGSSALRGVQFEQFLDKFTGIVFAWTFFHKENENAQQTRWLFLLLVKLGVDFSSTFQLLNPIMKLKLRQFRAGPNFYIFSDNRNVSLGIVGCSLYTRRIALKHDYHKNWLNMLAYTLVDFKFFTNWRL